MLLTEAAMLASGDSKAGCQQLEKELLKLSKPNHELTFNQKKRRRKKRAKLGQPASVEDWETASNDSVLTPQHGWPPAAGRGSEGCLAQSSMVTHAAAASAADQQQRHGFRAAACDGAHKASPAPEGGKHDLEGSSMPAPEAKRQKICPTTPLKPVTRQHRLAPDSQGICRVDLSATAAAAAYPDAAGSLALPAGLETPSRDPAAAAQNPQPGKAAAAHGASQQAAGRQRKERPVFLHGNYSRYYGYRLGHAYDEDPRMQVFKRAWFQGRRCLDIGCNSGAITLAIAAQLAPRSMLGVDIDASLIKKACSALAQQRSEVTRQVKVLQAPAHLRGPGVTNSTQSASQQRKAVETASRALASTWFEAEEFVTAEHEPQTLDTVLCLSVTKWVHLNQGDDGVKQLFQRVYDVLTPGGYFILEPQPWRSYKQTLHKQDMSAAPFASLDLLHLRPENFVKYLVQELHFTHVRDLEVQSSANGFNRPIHLMLRT